MKFENIIIVKHENSIEKKDGSWKIENKRIQSLGKVKKIEAGINEKKLLKFGSIEKNETINIAMHINFETLVSCI